MVTPPYLKPGDKVGLVSTARKVYPKEINPAISILESWDLEVIQGAHLWSADCQFGGTDEQRATELQAMLDDASIRAIICARGGYGTIRIVEQLDFSGFQKSPKWIVGYSDITILHSICYTQLGCESLHATMPLNFATNTEEALFSLRKALFGEKITHHFERSTRNRNGTDAGHVVGGNLSLLYSLIGTPADIDMAGKLLFIEDIDEYLYHLDRMIISLKQAGKLNNLAGLIVGGFADMNDNEEPFGKTAEEIIREHISEFDYPVAFNFPAGHIDDNRALIMGRKAQLMVGGNCSLEFVSD